MEEPLYPCSATRHPARGALPPRNQLQPSTCLPSWLPTLTSGPPACVKPMGHTVVSNSSLRPPEIWRRRNEDSKISLPLGRTWRNGKRFPTCSKKTQLLSWTGLTNW
ncbi:similar to RIKEN cDNA 1700088E04, isoform CRA_c [Rattus norvegicus]|uniref:Similar to RIKEN cDNA 1700088E04, isoform CRA_c n=1 Tax=Rattus norvegicus TaxID=10116 RepID=A6HSQ0_RAT|nr:similar to RIKEN cDNA 1700088E04, isoform CRA_c [Rattus norvegicus]